MCASGEGGKKGRFLLPPSLKSLLDHGLLDSIFGKQTKAYLVAVKWNFESGPPSVFRVERSATIGDTSKCQVIQIPSVGALVAVDVVVRAGCWV
jgi:hypothetical protein